MKYIALYFDGKYFIPQTINDARLLKRFMLPLKFTSKEYDGNLNVVSSAGYGFETIDIEKKETA